MSTALLWLPFIVVAVAAAALYAGFRRPSVRIAKASAVSGALTVAAAVTMFGIGKIFHIAHSDWLAAPIAAVALTFFQPGPQRKLRPAIEALLLPIAVILCAEALRSRGVAHPFLWALGTVIAGACVVVFGYPQVRNLARRAWSGL